MLPYRLIPLVVVLITLPLFHPQTLRAGSDILTPPPAPEPRINGPSVFGAHPGNPFLYSIPVTGTRPVTFAAVGLPDGLKIDTSTGRITGLLSKKGEYLVLFQVSNSFGTARKKFLIVAGDTIALTPPMGWNSWNCWGGNVDQEKVLRSAKALVSSGLSQHGWTYINIDDTWQGTRGGPFHGIQGDPQKFPDMKSLCDSIHDMGLKTGIYSTPWVVSYGNHLGGSSANPEGGWDPSANLNTGKNIHCYPFETGKIHFAANDARQWAAWGFDYLKYDWGPVDVGNAREMASALRASGRDIVFSLSNNAADNIFSIIADLGPLANSWRTTTDMNDSWESMSGIGFNQGKWAPFQHPGHYNDPDMLVVGAVGWGIPHPTRLTSDEQYTHISLWCLLGAPLLIGCDLEKLDAFTLSLLCNDEVLEIDQDPLCKQATCVAENNNLDVYTKFLADGSVAVGLFNRSGAGSTITANWSELKISGKQRVRNLWSQKDLGIFENEFAALVPPHGVTLLRLFPSD